MPLLEIRDLAKAYAAPEGGTHVVVDVPAFALDAQAQVALSGASGSGKTTFLNLIAGILAPDAGSIKLENFSVLSTQQVRGFGTGQISSLTYQQIDQFTTVQDLFPTLAAATGVTPRNRLPLDGLNLWDTLRGANAPADATRR